MAKGLPGTDLSDDRSQNEPAQADRLTWALEAYVRSSRALIHFRGLQDLVENVCNAIVEHDHYALAAVGVVPEGAQDPVAFLAAAGQAKGYADGLKLSAAADTVEGSGPTGESMRSGLPVILRDTHVDPAFAPWRARARPYGIRSSVTVPLKLHGVVRGVLIVYARRPDAFGGREMTLFRELADELAFAMSVDEDRARLAQADAARRQAEAELADTARNYKLLADHSSDIIIRSGRDLNVVYASPSVAQLGYRPEDLIGRRLSDFYAEDERELTEQRREALLAAPGPLALAPRQLRMRHADGRFVWLEAVSHAIPGPDGAPEDFIVQLRNVEARRAMEEELRLKRAEAEAATEAKSEFLANMSHEIRTPLTAILGFAGLLQDSPNLPPSLREHAERVGRAARSLHGIVDTILDFSELQAGNDRPERQPFNPADTISGTAAMVTGKARARGLQLIVADTAGLPPLLVSDAAHVRRALLSLLDNAIRFTDTGSVTVAARYLAGDAILRVEVVDTGPGIPAELSGRLFQSFSQLDGSHTRRHGGAGLGLATARRLVEGLGGDIGFESRPNEGATFWFEVPAALGSPALSRSPPTPPQGVTGGDVLVVDDAPMNREFLAAILESAGCRCQFAGDGAEAVAMAELAPFDLILMDMQMPVMDGPTAAALIRAGDGPNRETPILAVSANVLPEHVQTCLAAGMDDHVPKPIGLQDFLTKVHRWMGWRHDTGDLRGETA